MSLCEIEAAEDTELEERKAWAQRALDAYTLNPFEAFYWRAGLRGLIDAIETELGRRQGLVA